MVTSLAALISFSSFIADNIHIHFVWLRAACRYQGVFLDPDCRHADMTYVLCCVCVFVCVCACVRACVYVYVYVYVRACVVFFLVKRLVD